MERKFMRLVVIGAVIFIAASLLICSGLFSSRTDCYQNHTGLSMKAWLKTEGVVMEPSSSPKKNKVYQFVVASTKKLEKSSEQDGLWETCSKTDCIYYLFTDTKPQGK